MADIKCAIQYGDDYYKDLISACCDVSDRHKEYIKMANNSLKAWEGVIEELEETKEHATDLVRPKILGRKIKELTDMCFDEAIRIINKKLSEVEECTKAL